jgi:hypothetical protein
MYTYVYVILYVYECMYTHTHMQGALGAGATRHLQPTKICKGLQKCRGLYSERMQGPLIFRGHS